jgi:Fur family peroxide stress response transcriptional regulator
MYSPGSKRKHSRKRDAVLRALRSTETHPGAQWVYDQLRPSIPGLSLGTVYRNIREFRDEGTVASLGVVRGEERFDGRTDPHPHAVCTRCGKVADLPEGTGTELFTRPPVEIPGFVIDMRNTVFYGLCGKCGEEPAALGR